MIQVFKKTKQLDQTAQQEQDVKGRQPGKANSN